MSQGGATTLVETPENSVTANQTTETAEGLATPAWRRGFWSLVVTQFQGAFNENGLKNLVVFLILGMAMRKGDRDQLVLIVGTLFSLPFILYELYGFVLPALAPLACRT